jgi:hypothetical protein
VRRCRTVLASRNSAKSSDMLTMFQDQFVIHVPGPDNFKELTMTKSGVQKG